MYVNGRPTTPLLFVTGIVQYSQVTPLHPSPSPYPLQAPKTTWRRTIETERDTIGMSKGKDSSHRQRHGGSNQGSMHHRAWRGYGEGEGWRGVTWEYCTMPVTNNNGVVGRPFTSLLIPIVSLSVSIVLLQVVFGRLINFIDIMFIIKIEEHWDG
jgi:hypothetical protein